MDCKRCNVPITFQNGKCVDMFGRLHIIHNCKTAPGKVWCPKCQDKFSAKNPCEHYQQLGYCIGQPESKYINLIEYGTKKHEILYCETCQKDIGYMSAEQQKHHLTMHKLEENNQSTLAGFFS